MFSIKLKKNKEESLDKETSVKNKDDKKLQKIIAPTLATQKIKNKDKDEVYSFYSISYRLLANRASFLFPRLASLEKKLNQGGMLVYYKAYVCGLILLSLVMGVVGLGVGIGIALAFKISPPEFGMLLPFMLGTAASQGTFGLMYYYPKFRAKARATRITGELPYYIGYMATLSASGLPLERIFKAIAGEESKEEIVKDARVMSRNLEILGMDILTALKDIIERAPPGPYSELLEGLVTTVESGGSLKEYFTATAKVQLEEKKLLLRKMTASLGIVSELYTILLIVFPLLAIIMLSIMAIMTPKLAGLSLTTLMQMLTYGFVPLFGIVMLLMIDAMVPKR